MASDAPSTAPASQPCANAALQYWQAFALIPDDNDGSKPAPASVLHLLHRGAMIDHCDWGLAYEDGFDCLMPHIGKERLLASACLAAASQQWQGHPEVGAEIIADLLVFCRHVASDPMLTSRVVRDMIQSQVVREAIAHVPTLPPDVLRSLKDRMRSLPPEPSIADVFRFEKQMTIRGMREFLIGKPHPNIVFPKDFLARIQSLRDTETNDPNGSAARWAALEAAFDESIRLAQLPSARWLDDQVLKEKIAASGQLGQLLAVASYLPRSFIVPELEFRMFAAGLAVATDGEGALKNSHDLVGDEPFGYRKTAGGFVLESKHLIGGKPFTMTFGNE